MASVFSFEIDRFSGYTAQAKCVVAFGCRTRNSLCKSDEYKHLLGEVSPVSLCWVEAAAASIDAGKLHSRFTSWG